MWTSKYTARRTARHKGFTLIEVLVS
ncbi:prepilin-type N-terminal cleavage/methylation domain-containing protein, partial [Vibrio rotiferianus]